MFNQELFKKLNVLYVEDEAQIRDSLENVFKKLFKDVFSAKDGQEGVELYKKLRSDNIEVDLVISDINMPIMGGLEMLSEIRDIDSSTPFILTTAHAETDYFLEAIKLGVTHYAIKPINIKDLMLQIQDVCTVKYHQIVSKHKQAENARYIDIIDKVAIVTKTDPKGTITYANDIFCDVSGYSREELIGSNHRMVRHPDMPKSAFDSLWDTIRSGQTWKGKIKNKAKDGSAYIVNATIFPVYDDIDENIVEYMAVRFLITEEEEEKREFKKKVIQNIQVQKKAEQELKTRVKELEDQLKFTDKSSIGLVQDALEQEKQRSAKSKVQIKHYEQELKHEKDRYSRMFQDNKQKIADLIEENKEARALSHKHREKALALQLEVTNQAKEIDRLNSMVENQAKANKDLKEVIKQREEQLANKAIL